MWLVMSHRQIKAQRPQRAERFKDSRLGRLAGQGCLGPVEAPDGEGLPSPQPRQLFLIYPWAELDDPDSYSFK